MKVMNAAATKEGIKTLLGRRCRFPKYEPILRGNDDWGKFVPAARRRTYAGFTRDGTIFHCTMKMKD